MFRKYMYIFFLVCLPLTSNAGTMFLEDYPVMYFADKNGVKLDVVQDIIIDAIDRSSYPQHLWTVDSEKPGEIIARLNVRSHVLRMKITFDSHKINVQYHDSVRLSYSDNGTGTRRIHDKYKPWSEFLVSKIKFVAKRKTKKELLKTSPIKEVVITKSGEVAKPIKLIFSVYGDTNNRGRASGVYDDKAMSNAMATEILKYLNKIKPANTKIEKVNWEKRIYSYMYGRDSKTPANLCKEYSADVLLTGYFEDYVAGVNGNRDINYQLYTCRTEDVVKQKYDTVDSYDEKFAYHFGIIKNLKAFIRQYNPFQK